MLLKFMSVMPMLCVAHQRPPVRHSLEQLESLHFSWLDYSLVFRDLGIAPNAQKTGFLKTKKNPDNLLNNCKELPRSKSFDRN